MLDVDYVVASLGLYAYVVGQGHGHEVYLLIQLPVQAYARRAGARVRPAQQQKSSAAQKEERGEQNYPELRLTPHTAILVYRPPVVNRAAGWYNVKALFSPRGWRFARDP